MKRAKDVKCPRVAPRGAWQIGAERPGTRDGESKPEQFCDEGRVQMQRGFGSHAERVRGNRREASEVDDGVHENKANRSFQQDDKHEIGRGQQVKGCELQRNLGRGMPDTSGMLTRPSEASASRIFEASMWQVKQGTEAVGRASHSPPVAIRFARLTDHLRRGPVENAGSARTKLLLGILK